MCFSHWLENGGPTFSTLTPSVLYYWRSVIIRSHSFRNNVPWTLANRPGTLVFRLDIHWSIAQGSQPLWKSGKPLKMSFQFSSQGKLREFGKNTKNQGSCDSDPEGKGFRQYVRFVPCVQDNTPQQESISH